LVRRFLTFDSDTFGFGKTPASEGDYVSSRTLSDEAYVINLCDEVLSTSALRQHRFDFLRGDARPGKQGARLPVDAYYPDKQLVVEYCERQHTEVVPIMDRRMTVSGVDRGTQRAIYDQRRRNVLPKHGIALVELSYADFAHDKNKCLCRRRVEDLKVIRQALDQWARQAGAIRVGEPT